MQPPTTSSARALTSLHQSIYSELTSSPHKIPPQKVLTSMLRTGPPRAPPANTIDLLRGHPSTHLLATSEIANAASVVLSSADLLDDSYGQTRHSLHYGPDLGNEAVRREIGKWVSEKYELGEDIGA